MASMNEQGDAFTDVYAILQAYAQNPAPADLAKELVRQAIADVGAEELVLTMASTAVLFASIIAAADERPVVELLAEFGTSAAEFRAEDGIDPE